MAANGDSHSEKAKAEGKYIQTTCIISIGSMAGQTVDVGFGCMNCDAFLFALLCKCIYKSSSNSFSDMELRLKTRAIQCFAVATLLEIAGKVGAAGGPVVRSTNCLMAFWKKEGSC